MAWCWVLCSPCYSELADEQVRTVYAKQSFLEYRDGIGEVVKARQTFLKNEVSKFTQMLITML